jgi:hypothetical protein
MKEVYLFDKSTGFYEGIAFAQESPLEPGEYLLPECGTEEEPPAVGTYEIALWNNSKWQVLPNYKGVTYWLPDGTKHECTDAGVALPSGASLTEIKLLPDIKLELRTKVNEIRNELEVSGFPYMGKVFDSDPRSFLRIATANDAALKSPDFQVEWTTKDNSKILLNATEMLGVLPALAVHGQAIFSHSVTLKEAIEAAETLEALQAIDIESGWPDFL